MFSEDTLLLESISKEKIDSFPRLLADNYSDSLVPLLLRKICITGDLSSDKQYQAVKVLLKYRRIQQDDLYFLCKIPMFLKRFLKEEYCDSNTIATCMFYCILNNNVEELKLLFKYDIEIEDHIALQMIYYGTGDSSSPECLELLLRKFNLDLDKHKFDTVRNHISLDALKLLMKYGFNPEAYINNIALSNPRVEILQFLIQKNVDIDSVINSIMQRAICLNKQDVIMFAFKRGASLTKANMEEIDVMHQETLIFLAKNGVEREMFTSEQLELLDGIEKSVFM